LGALEEERRADPAPDAVDDLGSPSSNGSTLSSEMRYELALLPLRGAIHSRRSRVHLREAYLLVGRWPEARIVVLGDLLDWRQLVQLPALALLSGRGIVLYALVIRGTRAGRASPSA